MFSSGGHIVELSHILTKFNLKNFSETTWLNKRLG
jgi:hypothetical protein